jgi:DNA ligase (NAD+)
MKRIFFFVALGVALAAGAAEVPPATAIEKISALRRQIARHDERYFRHAVPEISDSDYDQLRRTLLELEQAFPDAARRAPPLPDFGDDRSGLFQTARHREPLLSLEKAYSAAEVRAFFVRLAKLLERDDLELVVEPKYDGLAVSVTYEHGRLVRALTRGNGTEGDDITANVRQIAGLPQQLSSKGGAPPELIELRGEIHVPFAVFERINVERENAGEPAFANPRALAAGTMRQTDPRIVARRELAVVFFGIGACEPANARPPSQTALHTAVKAWGLPGISDFREARGMPELLRALELLQGARTAFGYPIDGAVVKLNALESQQQIGSNDAAPRWALAYKFAPERAQTQLRAITLQVGRTGVLTPVAELVPVELAGSRISRATLHNRDEIARRDIRVGDFVYVEKAGEVIPAVVGVNLARRAEDVVPFQFPLTCTECYTALVQNPAEAAVRCPNWDCPAQVRRRIEHFAGKGCVDIDGLGPAVIDQLVGQGWVRDVPDLYRLHREDLLTLGKNNSKSVDRLLAAIEHSKRAELWRVIHGLGLPQVGAATAKDLARQCGSLMRLAEVGGKAVVALAEPRFQGLIADLIAVGFEPAEAAATPGLLAGKVFVLTGALPTLTRAQATARIEAAGGKVAATVTRATDYVIAGSDPGAKLTQARELEVPILDETALLQLLKAR